MPDYSAASLGRARQPAVQQLIATSAVLLLLIVCVGIPGAEACSQPVGWTPPSDIEMVIKASVVVYGRVLATYPDQQHSGDDVYTATVEVYCVMKGARTEQFVNISEAGSIPGLCHRTNLTVGHSYVILASRSQHDEYRPTDSNFHASQLSRLAAACGLQAVYPWGVDSSNATVKCPTPLPPGECKNRASHQGSSIPITILWICAFFLGLVLQ